MTFVYAAKGNSQQPDCTGFSPVSLLNAIRGVPVADAKVRKNMRISCQLQSNLDAANNAHKQHKQLIRQNTHTQIQSHTPLTNGIAPPQPFALCKPLALF